MRVDRLPHALKTDTVDLAELDIGNIRAILVHLCPTVQVRSVQPGPTSYSNRLWVAETDEGRLLVRVPGRNVNPDYMRSSIVAARLASEAGVPTPRLRAFAPDTDLGRPVVVQEFQPGERGTAVLEQDSGMLCAFASTLGDWIGTLHGIRRDGFGGMLSPVPGADWATMVRSLVTDALTTLDLAVLPASRSQIEMAFDTALAEAPHAGPASLVHGDIYFDNLLVRDGRAVCLLDFEHAHFYDRFADFGKVNELLFEWWPDSKKPFMEAYWTHFTPDANDAARLRLGVGVYELSQLSYFQRWQQDLVSVYRERLHRWLTNR